MKLRVFQRLGVETDYVENGKEALDKAAERGYAHSLIILDNTMPGLSGAETARELRRRGFIGPIIGITGDVAGCSERKNFEASGLTRCLDKDSAGLIELHAIVASFLRK